MSTPSPSGPDQSAVAVTLRPPTRWRNRARWAALVGLSILAAGLLELLDFPAALLLGPMFAGIVVAIANEGPRVPRQPFHIAQALVGCLIARSMPLTVFAEVGRDWPILLAGVAFVVMVAGLLGWVQMRWGVLPGTTAIWGSAPGGATATLLMAEAYGADVRLVALMQYMRVAGVALTASLVARFLTPETAYSAAAIVWFPPLHVGALLATLAVAIGGMLIGLRLKIPAGAMLVPLGLGIALSSMGVLTITLPPWLMVLAYTVIGWNIGLRFTYGIVRQSVRMLPAILLSTVSLIVICGLFSVLLVHVTGIDPMTAYLAMSPGSADSIAIIATSSHVDVSLVMAMQTSRLIVVMLIGPSFTRFLAQRAERGRTGDISPP